MSHFRTAFAASVASISMLACMGTPVMAQETTSVVRGTVTADGAPVAGATVTIVHVPSGTTATAVSGSSGGFTAAGLRVGGPFTVRVSADGYETYEVTDIYTVVAQAYELPIALNSTGGAIVVTAARVTGAGTKASGPTTVLTAEDIAKVASVNRDIRDLMRRDPFARLDYAEGSGRAVSFAGQNARFNRFTVDGVPVTDNFGLNPDGLPTRRSPVPLDAIGQFQTRVAPYDVREGNFQGGTINAILKSGTNEFHGTGFYAYSSDELNGKKTKAGPGIPTGRVTLPNFKYENYGAELSGPIVKDKLFFMIAGERIRAGTPIAEGTPGDNAGTVIPNVTDAAVAQIQQIAQSRYGYDTGGVLNDSADKDDRLVARLDANLSDTQRASLTYMYTKDSIQFNQNTNTTPASGTANATGLGLASNGYISSNRLHTGVFQLNSDWSDEFSTEVRAFYKDYKRGQNPVMGRGFAQFQVCTDPTSDIGTSRDTLSCNADPGGAAPAVISFGPDISRQSNQLTSRTYGGMVQARLTRDDHDLRVFADFQDTKIFNLFLQRTAGDYYFDSIADFEAGNAQRLRYQNAVPSLDPNDAAAQFRYQSYSFGIQDTWRINDMLTLAYGARYDMYGGDSRPALNQNFYNRYGFTNQAFVNGRGVFQPRLGLDFKPTRDLVFRAGAGIFSGGSPDVYVSNSFSNTGYLSNSIDIRRNSDGSITGTTLANGNAILTNVDGTTVATAADTVLSNASSSVNAPTNALDPKFKVPSQWRATLSADWTPEFGDSALGTGWRFGADFFYSDVRNQVFFTDLRVRPTSSRTPDGRVRYESVTTFSDTNSDLYLTNTKKGRSYIAVARFDKSFDFGLDIGASYTWQDVKDQAPATSSTASSNYGNGAFLDANGAAYGISNDEVKHNIKYNVSFSKAFFGDYKTTLALFGETRIGRPYSYTMQDVSTSRSGIFGTIGSNSRYLMYVPTSTTDPLVVYDSAATASYLDALINSTGLKKYRGQIAPRNAFNTKWFTRIDLHFDQEIPTGFGGSRITLFADIENFTNLLNKKWGQVREYAFPYNVVAVRAQCVQASGAVATTTAQSCAQYRYSAPNSTPTETIYSRQSLYTIRVGARFTF
ncbi:MAG: TonB-dependent receptor [Sphingobium sp.]|nr:MAG: TonB-dependent receptor [Sphingobium sp.]